MHKLSRKMFPNNYKEELLNEIGAINHSKYILYQVSLQ